jgi:hypothetical protein
MPGGTGGFWGGKLSEKAVTSMVIEAALGAVFFCILAYLPSPAV